MDCPVCGYKNEESSENCGRCGTNLAEAVRFRSQAVDDGETHYCEKHKRTKTNIRCGKCDRLVCPKCSVIGPAGIRCNECARNNIPIRPMGLLYELGRGLRKLTTSFGNSFYIWVILITVILGSVRGCQHFSQRNETRQPRQEQSGKDGSEPKQSQVNEEEE